VQALILRRDPRQQFIQFGTERQIIAAVRTLDEERHHENRERCDCIPLEGRWTEGQPKGRINNDHEKRGGWPAACPMWVVQCFLTGFVIRTLFHAEAFDKAGNIASKNPPRRRGIFSLGYSAASAAAGSG